jgi:hypothetical protein
MNITRRVTTAAAATLTILAMTGCTPTAATSESRPAEPAASATATPTSKPAPVEASGDSTSMVDADGKPVTVTDAYGTYTRTTINPAAAAMTVDPANLDTASLTAWSDAQIHSAQQWTARFIAEEFIDSEASDIGAVWEEWKADEGQRLIDTSYIDLSAPSNEGLRTAIVFNTGSPNNEDSMVFVRDGGPRIATTSINVMGVEGFAFEGTNYLTVDVDATAEVRVEDESVVGSYLLTNPDQTAAGIVEDYPEYGDGEINYEKFSSDINYRLVATPEGSWKIAGWDTSWDGEFRTD